MNATQNRNSSLNEQSLRRGEKFQYWHSKLTHNNFKGACMYFVMAWIFGKITEIEYT